MTGPWAVIIVTMVLALSSLFQPLDFSAAAENSRAQPSATTSLAFSANYRTIGTGSLVPIPPSGFLPLSASSYGGNTTLEFSVNATATLDIYVMNETQALIFIIATLFSLPFPAANFTVYHTTGSRVKADVPLPSAGVYFLVLDNDISGRTAYAEVAFTPGPIFIYSN